MVGYVKKILPAKGLILSSSFYHLGVSGPQNPIFSIWVEKRLRNGSETAGGTAEFRPMSRPALLLEMINDRGESYCHRTRHRGGRVLPVPGCPEGRRYPRRSTFKRMQLKKKIPNPIKKNSTMKKTTNNRRRMPMHRMHACVECGGAYIFDLDSYFKTGCF
jgi:hypothetical protein